MAILFVAISIVFSQQTCDPFLCRIPLVENHYSKHTAEAFPAGNSPAFIYIITSESLSHPSGKEWMERWGVLIEEVVRIISRRYAQRVGHLDFRRDRGEM